MAILSLFWPVVLSEHPGFGVVDHSDDRAKNAVVDFVDCRRFFAIQIRAFHGELDPYLSFRGLAFGVRELGDERRLISPFSPRFSQIRSHGAR